MIYVDYLRAKLELRFSSDEGATAVEYGIMVALIAVVIIAAVYGIGQSLKGDFGTVDTCLKDPSAASCK
jgi:pilus assembly protein Flp/PilA